MQINRDTVVCMSLSSRPGNFGTRFQNFLYDALNLNFLYKSFTTDDLEGAVRGIRALKIRGCAISMPYKEKVMEFLDEIDPLAKKIGAVNTIVNDDGFLKACNTDYIAVHQLIHNCGIPASSSVALLGSGGMAKAVVCALYGLGFRAVTIFARNQKVGEELAREYSYVYKERVELNGVFDLLINVTPIGMAPNPDKALPFEKNLIEKSKAVFDAVAYPPETELILLGQKLGKKTISGFEITVIQALEQFKLYTGITPPAELVKKAAQFARSV